MLATHRSAGGRLAPDAPEFDRAIGWLDEVVRTAPEGATYRVRLADAYARHADHLQHHRQLGRAEERYEKALAILDAMLLQVPNSRPALFGWAKAATGRNSILNQTGRHREAAAEWAKLAARDPDPEYRWRAELFVLQSLVFAGDWKAAASGAEALAKKPIPSWMCYETARVWCNISRQAGEDAELAPADRMTESRKAVDRAVALLERGRTAGLFKDERFVRLVETHPDLTPVRGRFDPRKQ
jgi:tetratricopeptide (TPR) repeat protein